MKAIDLFCGAGGLTKGLRNAGWEVVTGIDVDGTVADTYELNNPGSHFIHADLRRIGDEEVRGLVTTIPSPELLLAGCAPCQPFSKQRRRRGLGERTDAALLTEFARFVAALQPGVVLMENVPGIASVPGFSAFRRFTKTLDDFGYECDHGILNARDFGVPQHRRRYVLLATRTGSPHLPTPSVEDGAPNDVSVREAIWHFPRIEAGEKHSVIANHCAAGLSSRNLERIKATPPDGGSRRDWPERLQLELNCHQAAGVGFSDVYGRMWWDRAAPTLTSRCNSLSNGRFGHPDQHRAISLREAAALQTFPDDYEFFGSRNRIAQWIGNSVPVAFGAALGEAALKTVT